MNTMEYFARANDDRIPVSVTGMIDMDPNRIGRRMIWKFTFGDGSTLSTYSAVKGFRLANLMMKAKGL